MNLQHDPNYKPDYVPGVVIPLDGPEYYKARATVLVNKTVTQADTVKEVVVQRTAEIGSNLLEMAGSATSNATSYLSATAVQLFAAPAQEEARAPSPALYVAKEVGEMFVNMGSWAVGEAVKKVQSLFQPRAPDQQDE